MKTLMNSFAGFALTLLSALAVISCDPCSGVVCNNGTCSNGTCICEEGYERSNSSCVAVNQLYVGIGAVTTTVVEVDLAGNSVTRNNVAYTLTASEIDPYVFTLMTFNRLNGNDISFRINTTNYDVVEAGEELTSIGKNYTFSGAKVGSQVQLTIKDVSDSKTYTVSFAV